VGKKREKGCEVGKKREKGCEVERGGNMARGKRAPTVRVSWTVFGVRAGQWLGRRAGGRPRGRAECAMTVLCVPKLSHDCLIHAITVLYAPESNHDCLICVRIWP